MKKILLVTSVFPPSWGPGVHRISKIYKYLPNFGYFPIVLTTDGESYGIIDHSFDHLLRENSIIRLKVINYNSLSKKIWSHYKKENKVIRTKKNNKFVKIFFNYIKKIYNIFLIPDDRMFWIPLAILRGYLAIKKYQIELIYSTSPHYSSHIVALFLKFLTGLPWITDFRDPWVGNPFYSNSPKIRRLIDYHLEKLVIKRSTKIISVSKNIENDFKNRYPNIDKNKFYVLMNSYDPDDYKEIQATNHSRNKFIISHLGTFYGKRSPKSFLKVMSNLIEKKQIWKDIIEILLIGVLPQTIEDLIIDKSLKKICKFINFLPYKEALKLLSISDLVLLIPGPGKGTITTKVFDYIALKKPIILLSQNNIELEEMINEIKNGFTVPYHSFEEIYDLINRLIEEYFNRGKIKIEIDEGKIKQYMSIEMVRKLSIIMNEILKKGNKI